MSGLEVPGFLVGLSGLIPIVEKSLLLWQSLSEAKEFGSELMRIVTMLAIEYHRFLTWVRVLQPVPTSSPSQSVVAPNIDAIFSGALSDQLQAPIENAAARILAILGEISTIAEKYKLNTSAQKGTTPEEPASASIGLNTILPLVGVKQNSKITLLLSKHRESGRNFQEKIPFKQRFTFSTKPWGEPDKVSLEKKVGELSYWNDRLEGLLPSVIRQSVSNQALLSQILVDENKTMLDTLIQAADNENAAVQAHAKMWKERIDFSTSDTDSNALEKYRRSASTLSPISGYNSSKCALSLTAYAEGQKAPTLATVEWYPFGDLTWSSSDITLATTRLSQIVHLCSLDNRPSSLRTLDSICFVEKADSLGLVCRLPANASPSRHPVSLHALLAKSSDVVPGFHPPSLEQRLLLAEQLASSVYSFGIVRWYHKDLNSRNIILFRDNSSSGSVMLDSPHVAGFSISRPDKKEEKSLNKDLEARAIYLHPDLRVADPEQRPRYHLKYEMYSLGLLLFEIGVWNTLDHVVKSSLAPEEFKARVVNRCSKDLPFFVGTRYRDVVLRCLKCADPGAEESDGSLDTLYWSGVLELAKCR